MSPQPQSLLSINRLRRLLHPADESPVASRNGGGPKRRGGDLEPPVKKRKMAAVPAGPVVAEKAAEGEQKAESAQESSAAKKKRHRRKLSQRRQAALSAAVAAASAADSAKAKRKAAIGGDQLLLASKFRFLNEQLYTLKSSEAFAMFQADTTAFEIYHSGYESQRAKWTDDPLDWVVKQCRANLPADNSAVLVDFGCGDARLSTRVGDRCRRVHSLDLVALNKRVTACDMAHCPLASKSAHAAVFCLSLMNANLADFLVEASRVLKLRGLLCIVEARSRVERTQRFVNLVERFGFQCGTRREDKYLVYLLFSKTRHRKPGEPLPEIRLKPCLYKQR